VNAAVFRPEVVPDSGPAKIKIPEKDTWVNAKYLDGTEPDWKSGAGPRAVLAGWLTSADNPWFARAAVNRLWHYFFGTGLVDPVDGLGSRDNPPSHPELLDELARAFVAHQFDLKFLMRAITGSQAYQRTSRQTHPSQADPRRFARAAVRGLSAEQLLESVTLAAGYRSRPAAGDGMVFGGPRSPRAQFLAQFDDPLDQPTEVQTSIQQALFLMNGKFTEGATSPAQSKTLEAVTGAGPSVSTARRIEELYLATLSRKPRPEEAERLTRYVEAGDRKQAYADVLWALLNSTEFVLNH
jgi:hypothetical protein